MIWLSHCKIRDNIFQVWMRTNSTLISNSSINQLNTFKTYFHTNSPENTWKMQPIPKANHVSKSSANMRLTHFSTQSRINAPTARIVFYQYVCVSVSAKCLPCQIATPHPFKVMESNMHRRVSRAYRFLIAYGLGILVFNLGFSAERSCATSGVLKDGKFVCIWNR